MELQEEAPLLNEGWCKKKKKISRLKDLWEINEYALFYLKDIILISKGIRTQLK